jgi:peroxiredoxin Q/BCP
VILDRSGDEPEIVYTHTGRSTFDRPEIDESLGVIDDCRSDTGSPSASE